MSRYGLRRLAVLLGALSLVGGSLSGCDYWPPALQAQIEQLRAELQLAAAEKARSDNQVKEAVKSRDELQLKIDDMARINRELAGRVTTLEQSLASEREKIAKLSRSTPRTSKVAKRVAPTKKKAVTAKKVH
jgi:chromosome segregation ATPase